MSVSKNIFLQVAAEARQELAALRIVEEKYVYFLLATAGAAIAYAMQRTNESGISRNDGFLGLAVFCWGLSFFAGCRNRLIVINTTRDLAMLPLMTPGTQAEAEMLSLSQESTDEMVTLVNEFVAKERRRNSWLFLTAKEWFGLQFWFLIIGAIAFVTWHILGMLIRTL